MPVCFLFEGSRNPSMDSDVLSLFDEFTYLVNQVKFHLPDVEKAVEPIFNQFSIIQTSLKYAKEDAVEQNSVKDLEGIVHDAKAAIVNHALNFTTPRRRKETLFKRYAFCKRVETLFEGCVFRKRVTQSNLDSEIRELGNKLKSLSSHFLRDNAVGETSQGNRNNVAGEEISHQGKQLLDWMRSSAEYDETGEDIIIGLKHDIELLKARLLNNSRKNDLSVISVFGIQGIGKTVLAWQVYKSSDVNNHFACKAWVCISSVGNDIGEILKNIGKQVMGLQVDQETTDDGHEGLQKKLTEFLGDKKYLIVIDDVPGTKIWNALKKAFPNRQNGSRIMLITRDVEVAYLANSDGLIPHRLWVLSAADSWELFTRIVFGVPCRQVRSDACSSSTTTHNMMNNFCIPPQLDAIGRKMVKKCKGIPLLIEALADLVSSRPAKAGAWSSVLHSANMCLIGDDADRWFNLSGFLNKMISSLHVKQGLPHLWGVFPTEIEFPARRLNLSWAAEGLFFGQRYGEVAEEQVVDDFLQQLLHFDILRTEKVSSNGNAKTCSIPHDLPKRVVLTTGNALNSFHNDHRFISFHDRKNKVNATHSHPRENPKHNSHSDHPPVHDNHQQQQQQQSGDNANPSKALSSFWCFNFPAGEEAGKQLGHFLDRCISEGGLQFLGVLDLEGVYRPCLPEAIGELINLRYLGLRDTYIDTLPSSVSKLLKLQTLDIKHTYVLDYSQYSIQKLKKLQHLHLNEGQYSSEFISRLSHLTDLRTLAGIVVEELDFVKKDYGLCRLTNLRKLRFTCHHFTNPEQRGTMEYHCLEGLEQLRSLKVRATIEDLDFVTKNQELTNLYLLGSFKVQFDLHNKLPENLTTLTLSGSDLIEDPMPKLEMLPKLQFLRLLSKSFMGNNMVCSSGGFGQLRVLRIWKLEELEKLTVEEGAMANLEELEIRFCKNFKELSGVPVSLSELKLTRMPEEFTKKCVKYKVRRVLKD